MSDTYTEIDVPETLRLEQAANAQETPPAEDAAERQPSPRDVAMAAIAERRREAIERELAHGVVMEDEARLAGGAEPLPHTPEGETTDGAENPGAPHEPATAIAQVSPPVPASDPAPSGQHVVTVGGQTFVVNDEQFAHLANIGAVASVAMQQQARAPQATPAEAPAAPTQAAPPRDTAKLAETWRKISYGTEEEGVAALADLMATAQPPVDARAITEQAKAEMRAEAALQANLMTVAREFPDVMGPNDRPHTPQELIVYGRRAQLAALALHDIRQRDAMLGQQRSDLETYREAAMQVRASLGTAPLQSGGQAQATNQATQAAQPSVSTGTERLERKRAAPRAPSAVSRASMGAPMQQQQTASDIVAWMAKRRNQQSPVRT